MSKNRLKIWYKGLCEILDGYKSNNSICFVLGITEEDAIAAKNEARTILSEIESSNSGDDTKIKIYLSKHKKQIILSLKSALDNIPEWELPLRMDVTREQIENEIKKLESQN